MSDIIWLFIDIGLAIMVALSLIGVYVVWMSREMMQFQHDMENNQEVLEAIRRAYGSTIERPED